MIKLPTPAMPTSEEVDNAFASPQWNEQYIRQTSLMAARMHASLAFPGAFRSQLLPNLSIIFGHGMGIDVLYNDEEFVFQTHSELHVWLSRVLSAEMENQDPTNLVGTDIVTIDRVDGKRVYLKDWVSDGAYSPTKFNFSYDSTEAYVFERKSELDLVCSFVLHLAERLELCGEELELTLESGWDNGG